MASSQHGPAETNIKMPQVTFGSKYASPENRAAEGARISPHLVEQDPAKASAFSAFTGSCHTASLPLGLRAARCMGEAVSPGLLGAP